MGAYKGAADVPSITRSLCVLKTSGDIAVPFEGHHECPGQIRAFCIARRRSKVSHGCKGTLEEVETSTRILTGAGWCGLISVIRILCCIEDVSCDTFLHVNV